MHKPTTAIWALENKKKWEILAGYDTHEIMQFIKDFRGVYLLRVLQ